MNTTTRTMHATTLRKIAVRRVVTERLAARLDADAPAKMTRASTIVPDDTVLRLPDYREDGMLVFIGEDATVLVEEDTLERLPLLLHVGGIKGRSGHMPDEEGIAVFPHTDTLVSPTYAGKNGECQMAWRLVHDTLSAA